MTDRLGFMVNYISETVFPGITTVLSVQKKRQSVHIIGSEIASNLPLQMALYFNGYFFPWWIIVNICTIHLKYSNLTSLLRASLITVFVASIIIEIIRLYLGYLGNLTEKVPELAGFWLLSILLQFPLLSFLLFNESILVLPLEKAVNSILLTFIIFEIIIGYFAIKAVARQQMTRFHIHHLKTESNN